MKGEGILNEGFMIMMRNQEQKINVKIINNNEELCQKYISISASDFKEDVVHLLYFIWAKYPK